MSKRLGFKPRFINSQAGYRYQQDGIGLGTFGVFNNYNKINREGFFLGDFSVNDTTQTNPRSGLLFGNATVNESTQQTNPRNGGFVKNLNMDIRPQHDNTNGGFVKNLNMNFSTSRERFIPLRRSLSPQTVEKFDLVNLTFPNKVYV